MPWTEIGAVAVKQPSFGEADTLKAATKRRRGPRKAKKIHRNNRQNLTVARRVRGGFGSGCKGCHVDVRAVVLSKARANHRAEAERSYYEGRHRCSERTAWFIRFWENAPLLKMLQLITPAWFFLLRGTAGPSRGRFHQAAVKATKMPGGPLALTKCTCP